VKGNIEFRPFDCSKSAKKYTRVWLSVCRLSSRCREQYSNHRLERPYCCWMFSSSLVQILL